MKLHTSRSLLTLLLLLACALFVAAGCGSDDSSSASTDSKSAKSAAAGNDESDESEESEESDSESGESKQWSKPPKMTIDKNGKYSAVLVFNKGSVTIELDAKKAPNAVNNFVFLAKEGFYTDVPVHRIISGFMMQTGDPTGTGTGGPGYTIPDDPGGKYVEGAVAMANTGAPDSGGSQFFITFTDTDLPPTYALFGKVTKGMDVVKEIEKVEVVASPSGEPSQPTEDITLESVTVSGP